MILEKTLDGLRIGEPVAFGGLTMLPLLGEAQERDYLTLDEALRDRVVEVSELDESGSVPELRLINHGEKPIFLLDGEEVVGAKQNRVLNLSVLAPGKSSLVIPVSCVEQGRWQSGRSQFQGGSYVHFASGRAKKLRQVSASMGRGEGHHSDQSEVWADIGAMFTKLKKGGSRTHAMHDAFEAHTGEIEGYVSALRRVPGQLGAAFGFQGQLRGLDLFDSPLTLRLLLPKLVRSWALDAIASGGGSDAPLTIEALERFLARLRAAQATGKPALGLGEEVRLSGAGLAGAALCQEERLVHLAAFEQVA